MSCGFSHTILSIKFCARETSADARFTSNATTSVGHDLGQRFDKCLLFPCRCEDLQGRICNFFFMSVLKVNCWRKNRRYKDIKKHLQRFLCFLCLAFKRCTFLCPVLLEDPFRRMLTHERVGSREMSGSCCQPCSVGL